MKHFVFFLTLALSMTVSYASTSGDEPVPLKIKQTDPGSANNPPAKGPILIPTVYQNGNVLTFDEALEGTTVQLLDEDDTIVFSDFIEENQTSIVFPTTLFGSYKLLIVCSDITFYCEIQL